MDIGHYTFILDVDGTLCPIKAKDEKYEDLVPYPNMVDKLRALKRQGARIVLFSSRNMNTYAGNLGLINKHTAAVLSQWLARWDIPYDEILYGKPWPGHYGFYVDDRTVRPNEFLSMTVDDMERLCQNARDIGGENGDALS